MKKTSVFLLILIIVSALIIAGCGNEPLINKKPYLGGNEGLAIKFQSQRPPETIYSAIIEEGETVPGNSFSIGVQLENKGEEGIFSDDDDDPNPNKNDYGRLTLRGINPSYYNLTQEETIIEFDDSDYEVILRPKSKVIADGPVSPGGMANVQFPSMSYQHLTEGFNEITFTVDLCYNYRTRSTTTICVVKDTISNKNICNPTGTKTPSNSGSPVHVKSILQQPSKNKLGLVIEIQKVDNAGEVYAPIDADTITTNELVCDDVTTNTDKNKVYVNVSMPEADISCSDFKGDSEGLILLNEGAPTVVFCDLDTSNVNQDYESQLSVDLEYSFGKDIRKTVTLAKR